MLLLFDYYTCNLSYFLVILQAREPRRVPRHRRRRRRGRGPRGAAVDAPATAVRVGRGAAVHGRRTRVGDRAADALLTPAARERWRRCSIRRGQRRRSRRRLVVVVVVGVGSGLVMVVRQTVGGGRCDAAVHAERAGVGVAQAEQAGRDDQERHEDEVAGLRHVAANR